ncbi:outer membrane protein assembly factor BamD [Allorhizobium taibaishanense]|uniref:Outer membrane protein assembly factor BamD n=1 Tax=Allorhizobium taibaishanense TaxID=887144 RepID=A0A7W6HJL6_9HYPH|nr:outer membrane protein assembly factor BamD [Allorhizobium taibaishanense]MBB4006148.1 outer membrane protein assembly factor BamD [Allorhizobium taibaishanense]
MSEVKPSMINQSARMLAICLSVVSVAPLLSACNTDKDIDITKLSAETDPPEQLYDQGLANIKAGNLAEASRKFDAVDKQNPFSDWSQKALVMSTFVKYRQGKYTEAIATGTRYMTLYPSTKDSAYVQYLIGLSNWRQIPNVTQDQKYSARTLEAMDKLVKTYPTSEYVSDAQEKMRFARDQLAGKEMQIGRYYLERKEYLASIQRFRNVVEQYPTTNQIEEALARLVEAYYAMGVVQEAQTAAAVLGHNYPDSKWYKDSFDLLKNGGVSPQESQESWISKAGKKLLLGSS